MASGIAVSASEFAAIIGVYAVAAPEPAIDELVLIEDGIIILGKILDGHYIQPMKS